MKVLLLLLCVALAGCATKLEPNGPYNNVYVYNAEASVTDAFKTFDALLKFEYDNRASLTATSPKIKEFCDYIRVNGPKWKRSFEALDADYKASPTTENKDKVENMLLLFKSLLAQASAYLAVPVTTHP